MGQLVVIGRTVRSQVPTLKGTEVSLSHVQCFWYFISSSINVSIFSWYMAGYPWEGPSILCLRHVTI